MKDFVRVLRLVLRRRMALFFCLTSSLLVALLWGLNISTVYPLVDVIFQGKGAAPYVAEQAIATTQSAADAAAQVLEYRRQLADAEAASADKSQIIKLQWQLDSAEKTALAHDRSSQILEWIQPWAVKNLPVTPFGTLALVVAALIAATIVKLIALMMNLMLVQDISQRIGTEIRELFYRRALRQDLEHFGDVGSSGLTSRLTGDVNDLTMGVSIVLGRLIREPLKAAVCLIGAGIICWRLLILTFIVAPLVGLVVNSLSRSIRRSSRRVMEEMTLLYGMLSESFAGIRIVRAYNTEAFQRARFRRGAIQYYRKSMKVAFYNAASRFATEALGTTILCVGLLAGGFLVLNQETHLFGVIRMSNAPLSVGEMILFFGLLIGASDPARKLSDVWSNLQRGIAAAERVMEVIDAPVRIKDTASPVSVPRPHKTISIQNVAFHYPTGPQVLRDFNLEIPHGQTLAVVGPNGSGKSTLVGLLCRFDDPIEGQVMIDGVDVRQMRSRDLRRRIGLVTQRTVIFDDTILNNIRYGSPRATREDAIRAAKQAYADEFICTKTPDGYDSLLGHGGTRLSGGQMQRIALARAFLRSPDILILDEATSQIDLESERLIHDALAKFLVGRTGIMITHRPTTLALADQVAVIEAGVVTDCGSHLELSMRNAFYQSLCGTPGLKAA
jgi:subfamily B ATP-binding cassette protein MsbA